MAQEKFAPMKSLIASARRITKKDVTKGSVGTVNAPMKDLDWQREAWEMYDLVGEQHFLANTLAERLSQARIYIGRLSPGGTTPEEVTEEEITDILEAFGGTHAGRSQLLKRLAINLLNTGDGWLVGVPNSRLEEDEELSHANQLDWYMLSVDELSMTRQGKVKMKLPDRQEQEYEIDDNIMLVRVWNPHPRHWERADSSTKASLPVLKEIVGLTMHTSSQIESRLAGAGLLLVPQSAQRALAQAAEADEDEDQFTEALIEAMLTPIQDRTSPAALVPLVVTVPDEAVSNFRHISFSGQLDGEAHVMREDAIRRLALSQDAPPEVLLGTAGMNHWGGWLVKEETISAHIEPQLALICDALTSQYLWPTLVDLYNYPEDEAEQYVVWYDVSHLIARPNASSDALNLFDRGVITDSSLKRALGYDDPDDSEEGADELDKVTSIVYDMVRQNPGLMINPGVDVMVREMRKLFNGSAGDENAEAPDGEYVEVQPPSTESPSPGGIPDTAGDPPSIPEA